MILHAQRAVNQHREYLFSKICIGANDLGLSAHALEDDALASGVAHDSTQGRFRGADLPRLGQPGTDRDDDF